jgi:histidinol-phosphatase (PHP family)
MRKDYHTHTFRCQHAIGDVIDYAASATKQGFQVIGSSDHTPFPDGRWNTVRMGLNELDNYIAAIEEAKTAYPELIILKGLECEYSKESHNFFQEELLGKYQFDYLISGPHHFLYNGKWTGAHSYIKSKEELYAYTKQLIESMASGLFAFVAHPDLFGSSYELWDENAISCSKQILEAAVEYQIPLEINANGFRKPLIETPQGKRPPYPLYPFWELAAEYDLHVVVNSDAHHPENIGDIKEAVDLVKRYHLQLADLSYLEEKYLKP